MDMTLKKIRDLERSTEESLQAFSFYSRRKIRKLRRSLNKTGSHKTAYTFAITCVKKPEYVRMAIDNINSLNYLNEAHSFVIYADTACTHAFAREKCRLDYPLQTRCDDTFGVAGKPWQTYKVETIIDSSKKGFIFTDADGIWHDEPAIDPHKITILVLAHAIKDNPVEKKIAETLFKGQNAVGFNHYVSGFLSIPPALMTEALANDMRKFTRILLDDSLSFLAKEEDQKNIHRLAEELGVNIAIQANHGAITTLKQTDGPKSREVLQSLYYGCNNGIID